MKKDTLIINLAAIILVPAILYSLSYIWDYTAFIFAVLTMAGAAPWLYRNIRSHEEAKN